MVCFLLSFHFYLSDHDSSPGWKLTCLLASPMPCSHWVYIRGMFCPKTGQVPLYIFRGGPGLVPSPQLRRGLNKKWTRASQYPNPHRCSCVLLTNLLFFSFRQSSSWFVFTSQFSFLIKDPFLETFLLTKKITVFWPIRLLIVDIEGQTPHPFLFSCVFLSQHKPAPSYRELNWYLGDIHSPVA